MTFDSCYLLFDKQSPLLHEVCLYWEALGYKTTDSVTNKIHIWTSEGDEILVDNISQAEEYKDFGLQLWLSSDTTVYLTLKERGGFFSEEYSFDGLSRNENINFVRQLTQRYLPLVELGTLSGVLFDRKDCVLEALSEWK